MMVDFSEIMSEIRLDFISERYFSYLIVEVCTFLFLEKESFNRFDWVPSSSKYELGTIY